MAGRGAQLPFHHPQYELVVLGNHQSASPMHRTTPQISLLGSGASSTVYLARDTSGTKWAIKLIKRGFGSGPDGNKVILTSNYLGVVQEYVNFGNLRALVQRHGPLGESDARSFFHKLIASVAYCHAKGIANRDIKCENTLLALRDDGRMDVKLCDFGLSKRFTGSVQQAQTLVGSPFYVPPEVIRAGHINLKTVVPTATYDASKADTWCCGVTLYYALTAQFPHVAREAEDLKEIQQWQLAQKRMLQCGDFEERRLSNCTPECVAFLRRLLCTDPMQRPSVAEIVADPWLQVDMPPDYAELVLHTPLLFEQQTLIHCEQGDEEICRLCKEAAWAGQGDVQGSDSRDDDDFEDVIDSMVSFGGAAGGRAGTPTDMPSPQHSGGAPGSRIVHSVGQQLQEMHLAPERQQSTAEGFPDSPKPPTGAPVSLSPAARQMLLENAALAQHCGVVQGMLLDELEKTLLTMLECLQRMEHYRQRL